MSRCNSSNLSFSRFASFRSKRAVQHLNLYTTIRSANNALLIRWSIALYHLMKRGNVFTEFKFSKSLIDRPPDPPASHSGSGSVSALPGHSKSAVSMELRCGSDSLHCRSCPDCCRYWHPSADRPVAFASSAHNSAGSSHYRLHLAAWQLAAMDSG